MKLTIYSPQIEERQEHFLEYLRLAAEALENAQDTLDDLKKLVMQSDAFDCEEERDEDLETLQIERDEIESALTIIEELRIK